MGFNKNDLFFKIKRFKHGSLIFLPTGKPPPPPRRLNEKFEHTRKLC